jgi:hypothetical protein
MPVTCSIYRSSLQPSTPSACRVERQRKKKKTNMTQAHSKSCFQQFWDGVQVKRNSGSFTIELLPSLGATINQSNKLRKFIISPYDPCYR